jgi:hypothetical protein
MPTKLIRMISPARDVTEVNFSQWGIFHPDAEGAFYIPADAVSEAQKASLELAPLAHEERLARIVAAIRELDEGETRTSLLAAVTSVQMQQAQQAQHAQHA